MFYVQLQCIFWRIGGDIRPNDIQCLRFKFSCAVACWRFDRRSAISRLKNFSIHFNSIYSVYFVTSVTLDTTTQFTIHIKILKTQFTSNINTLNSQVKSHICTLKVQNTSYTIKYNTLYNAALISTLIKMDKDDQWQSSLTFTLHVRSKQHNSSTDATERILISF